MFTCDVSNVLYNCRGVAPTLPFDEQFSGQRLEPGALSGVLLNSLTDLAVSLIMTTTLKRKSDTARALAFAFRRAMLDAVNEIADDDGKGGTTLRDVAIGGEFPKLITASRGGRALTGRSRRMRARMRRRLPACSARRRRARPILTR